MTPADLRAPPYGLRQAEKEARLVAELSQLTALHRERCAPYRRLLDALGAPRPEQIRRVADVPWLPVGLFKTHRLLSVPDGEVFKTMTSSGTTSQRVSVIHLDRETAGLQTAALASILGAVLGPKRLPMLILDTATVLAKRTGFSARTAGVLGMMNFGRAHTFLLDEAMALDRAALDAFLRAHGQAPFLVFGLTYLAWEHLCARLAPGEVDLSQGVLVHSGGWKKLQERALDGAGLRAGFLARTGLRRVYDFYGMVEQVGSVFLEGDDGFLYPPWFADVVVRDPRTWEEAPTGTPGVIEVVSALPRSYPGHALLTEDLGVVHGVDDSSCGRYGKRFKVLGRLPRAELRGCSDVHALEAAR